MYTLRYANTAHLGVAGRACAQPAHPAKCLCLPTMLRLCTSAPVVLQLHGGPTGVEGPGLSPQQKGLYFLGTVLLPYLWVRASRAAVSADWNHSSSDPNSSSSNWFQEEEDETTNNNSSSSSGGLAERMWRTLRWLEGTYRAASVVNMWLFLYDGRYRWAAQLGGQLGFHWNGPEMCQCTNLCCARQPQRTAGRNASARPPPCSLRCHVA
jgi:hypothetical protein